MLLSDEDWPLKDDFDVGRTGRVVPKKFIVLEEDEGIVDCCLASEEDAVGAIDPMDASDGSDENESDIEMSKPPT